MQPERGSWFAVVGALLTVTGCASQGPVAGKAEQVSQVCSTVGRADAHRVLLKRENIVSVAPLSEQPFVARRTPLKDNMARAHAKLVGVRVVIKPAPGLTSEWLQLLANCDRKLPPEQHAVDIECPFELENTSASVVSMGDAFAIDVTSHDPGVVDEAIRRAVGLSQANDRPSEQKENF